MEQLAGLKNALSRLGAARVGAMGVVAVAVLVAMLWVALRPGEPMGLLYSGLDPSEAGKIAQRLDELRVPMEARGDGTTIMVPASQVARARMDLAASGLPHQGGAGYELLDTQSPLNMTSFMQRVQRTRALEGELARTILALNGVKSARVHIVMPERETFSREAPKPTASVAVTMEGVERLTTSQAAAIRLLVAGAVPQLSQEDVSVLDPNGVVLAADGGDAVAAGRLGEIKAAREKALQSSVIQLLEPLVGRGRVRAIASVEVNDSRETSREEKFDPLSQVERSRQTQKDQDSSTDSKPGDPVTVAQNLPNQQVGGTGNGTQSTTASSHNGETVNYEISNTVDEKVREPGALRRLTVAVVVDGTAGADGKFVPRPKEELDRFAELVRSAVGYDEKRGDKVTVDTMPFVVDAAQGELASNGKAATGGISTLEMLIGLGVVLALMAVAGLFALRRRQRAQLALAEAERLAIAAQEADPVEEMVTLASMEGPIRASSISGLHELVDARFDESLAVLRAWIAEGGAAA